MKVCKEKLYLGVEIGGTKQQICLGYADGRILETRDVRLGQVTAKEILAWIAATIKGYMTSCPVSGIGVGFGGPLELATGRVLCSLQVEGWEDFELKTWFEKSFGLPVMVANDTFTGGVGEMYAGAGRESANLLYTNIGTGIGGGLFINGKGYDGSGFGAAYLGNTWVPDWQSDEKGAMTRMELLVSGLNISRRLSCPGYVPKDSLLFEMGMRDDKAGFLLTAYELGKATEAGDSFAAAELDRIARSFSVSLTNMLALTGVSRVVIGGGVAKMGDILFDRIRCFTDDMAFAANKGLYEILPSPLMDKAVPTGALILAAKGEEIFM